MSSMLLLLTYASVAVFLAAIALKAARISRLPIHLRWELYPVAHEKGRASYGGSYLEEPDWWTKPRESSLLGELRVMIPEILLLAAVWEHNRKHWFRSFPFHFGLYLLAGLIGLLLLGGVAVAAGADVSATGGPIAAALYHVTYLVGYAGLALGLIGAIALLARRTLDDDYREYTKKADYFNLGFFVVTFVVALAAQALTDPHFATLRDYFARFLTFNLASASGELASPSGLVALEIVLASLLLAYIPLTHMSHFFAKWFTYHHVRWSDEPNLRGGKIEQQVNEALKYPVSWSAPHIRGDGKKNWVDVATAGVEEENEE
ncbi:MAG: respiratory nitrate reductase subunit gamma [Planctomycetes bacterium]|nr:respiratory nitrate reductase subunit gamma [Planctomycetota bacterium]